MFDKPGETSMVIVSVLVGVVPPCLEKATGQKRSKTWSLMFQGANAVLPEHSTCSWLQLLDLIQAHLHKGNWNPAEAAHLRNLRPCKHKNADFSVRPFGYESRKESEQVLYKGHFMRKGMLTSCGMEWACCLHRHLCRTVLDFNHRGCAGAESSSPLLCHSLSRQALLFSLLPVSQLFQVKPHPFPYMQIVVVLPKIAKPRCDKKETVVNGVMSLLLLTCLFSASLQSSYSACVLNWNQVFLAIAFLQKEDFCMPDLAFSKESHTNEVSTLHRKKSSDCTLVQTCVGRCRPTLCSQEQHKNARTQPLLRSREQLALKDWMAAFPEAMPCKCVGLQLLFSPANGHAC
ncbi:putative soluble cytochrome b562 1 [Varanus komodoensis]|nr:putative soluble cytochrome b562 1 [Varanus komodoensis]